MLAINPSSTTKKVTPNILPCAITHNGPVNAESRYWSPTQDADASSSTAYFRGRKLRGRTLKVPDGYQGVVLEKSERSLPQKAPHAEQLRRMEEDEDEEMEAEVPVDVKMMDQKARFDEIMVWGHEAVPEDDDVYVKGVQEWISLAEAVFLSTHDGAYAPLTLVGRSIRRRNQQVIRPPTRLASEASSTPGRYERKSC